MRIDAVDVRRLLGLAVLSATLGACSAFGKGPAVLRPGSNVTRPLRPQPRLTRQQGETCAIVPLAAIVLVVGTPSTCQPAARDSAGVPMPATLPRRP